MRPGWRAVVTALGTAGLMVGVLVAPAGQAFAGTVALPRPVVGSVTDVDSAFAELMIINGMGVDEVCLALTNTVASTHALRGTASDQTLACGIPARYQSATQLQQYSALVRQVRTHFANVTKIWNGVSKSRDTYNLLRSWAENLTRCGDAWLVATLGPINFGPYHASPTFAQEAMERWDACVAADPTPPKPGPGGNPGTDPGTPPGAGNPPPVVPTYLERVTDRLSNDALIRRNRRPDLDQAKRAAQTCIEAEQAARAAAVIGQDEHPCTDDPIFFPGADAGHAALHDAQAIATHPTWAKLTYMSGKSKRATGVKNRWYGKGDFGTSADGRCWPDPAKRGTNCDEYPYYSTVEGGPGASLREVPAAENQAEGNALNQMYSDPNCRMEGVGSGSTRYFVVPVAVPLGMPGTPGLQFAGPPSMHVCVPAPPAPTPDPGNGGGGPALN